MIDRNFSGTAQERVFLSAAIALSLILSFAFGYTFFRYQQIEICKPEMQVHGLASDLN